MAKLNLAKNLFYLAAGLFLFFIRFVEPVYGQVTSGALISLEAKNDQRIALLRKFLEKYNSPLAAYAADFVAASDSYGVDWRLLPAIAGIESTFGKQIPSGSFNAYGWNNGDYQFGSWEDSIWYITAQLRTRYLDRGADNIYKIGRIYCPPNPEWPYKVQSFMNKIESASSLTPNL